MSDCKKNENNEIPERSLTGPSLCQGCYEFFGNPSTENLCSSCFKAKISFKPESSHVPETDSPKTTQDSIPLASIADAPEKILEEEKAPEPAKTEEAAPEAPGSKQTDHGKCWKCTRKVGLLGFQCKCGFTYCKAHRLPEEHTCDFDFAAKDKEKLRIANPVVKASKIDYFQRVIGPPQNTNSRRDPQTKDDDKRTAFCSFLNSTSTRILLDTLTFLYTIYLLSLSLLPWVFQLSDTSTTPRFRALYCVRVLYVCLCATDR
eukprot:TRINITY_DN1087_c0_g1_i7.p1 TRINITY_DN1087_c0_g1~~TRINITY_DN1087_c0_g1_i7.p1  ORF type:complete len:261 (+),score=37.85 TRINITY_DN1087_c0_g1_i7:117-899(+)